MSGASTCWKQGTETCLRCQPNTACLPPVLPGARLLALLDHSPSTASAISSPAGGEGGAADGGGGGVDVFVAFPKRVGRAAALDTALTLRATYLMAYHDVE